MTEQTVKRFFAVYLALVLLMTNFLSLGLIIQPSFAKAQDNTDQLSEEDIGTADSYIDDSGSVVSGADSQDEADTGDIPEYPDPDLTTNDAVPYSSLETSPEYLATRISWMASAPLQKPALAVGPQDDVNKLSNYKADRSVTEYLLSLITPTSLGGYGINHIKVQRIENSYTSNGKGKNDRENAGSLEEDAAYVSAHHSGLAVDISEYGAITCKLVEKSYLGGNKTRWLDAQPVKLAWQSVNGIKNSPTPTAQSLMEAAGLNSASGITNYLNETGQMDAYADYVKGLNLGQIISYVGANVYLKTYATSSIVSDPLADSFIHIIGGAALEKAIPGLPKGIAVGDNDEDARIVFAKSQIETGLNLPQGSLRGYGWDGILESTGKRNLENALGLPALYLETKTLQDVNGDKTLSTALDKFKLSDQSFNVPDGTIEKIKKNDTEGLKLAGINILASAFKLTSQQRDAIVNAVNTKVTPAVDLSTAPTDSKIGIDDLKNMFAADQAKQSASKDALKQQGLVLIREAISAAAPKKFSGVTEEIMNLLLDTTASPTLADIKQTVGENKLAYDAGLDDSQKKNIGKNDKVDGIIAQAINDGLSLSGTSELTAADIKASMTNGNRDIFNKIGGQQVDKAMRWDTGTGFKILSGQISTEEAFSQVAANAVSSMFGLDLQGVKLTGDISANYGNAIIDSRLGLEPGTFSSQSGDAKDLSAVVGAEKMASTFNLPAGQSLDSLRQDSGFWEDSDNQKSWEAIDINNNLPLGSTKSYLMGEKTAAQYRKDTAKYNAINITADKLWNYFNLQDKFKIDATEALTIAKVIGGGDDITMDQRQGAINSLYKILGRSVEQSSGFKLDTIASYFLSSDETAKTQILLENGIRILANSLGLRTKTGDETAKFEQAVQIVLAAFGKDKDPYADDQIAHFKEMFTDLVIDSVGIPTEYRADAAAFAKGDFRGGWAAVTFVMYQKTISPYLPEGGKLDYSELSRTINFDIHDPALMNQYVPELAPPGSVNPGDTIAYIGDGRYSVTPAGSTFSRTVTIDENAYAAKAEPRRKDIMQTNQKNVEYKVSDSFLRKADATIPAGFTRAMFEGSQEDRTKMLMAWGFNNVDKYLAAASSAYVPGTLEKIYNGNISSIKTDDLIKSLVNNSGISFGPFGADFVSNFYTFIKDSRASGTTQASLFGNDKYATMWTTFDGWLSNNLGIGNVPTGLAKSIFLSSQNNWSLKSELKDANGNVIVPSLSSMGQEFLTNKITGWADKQLGIPIGRVYQLYKSYTAYTQALSNYQAVAASDTAAKAAASKSATAAANAMILLAVEIGLEMCDACQAVFNSIDQAIKAPAGFTQAVALGALAMWLNLGPWGLIGAGVLFLFGTYETEYLCPKAPYDPFAISGLDPPEDQLDYGTDGNTDYSYTPTDQTQPVKYSPLAGTTFEGKFGEDPFAWQSGAQWGGGDNQKLWMNWARYFTGSLLQNTLDYGAKNREILATGLSSEETGIPINQLQQVITYRQANAEYFAPESYNAFGIFERDNTSNGLFYTQSSTKITDWVHVGFGGIL